jgi:hypothetical protein
LELQKIISVENEVLFQEKGYKNEIKVIAKLENEEAIKEI